MELIDNLKISKIFTTYFVFGAIGGCLSIWLLVRLPTDHQTAVWLGYSPSRLALLITICVGIFLFLWLARKSKNPDWQSRYTSFIDKLFRTDKKASLTTGLFLITVILGSIFLFSSNTQTNYLLRPHLVRPIELARTIMDRLAPVVLWMILLSFQTLILFSILKYSIKDHYYGVIRAISIFIFPIILIIFFLVNQIDSRYYRYINNEDNLVEWLTFAFLIISGLLSMIMLYHASKSGNPYTWFYLIFGIACIILGFEEISWGQRVLGVESPLFFMENSDQQEINVHNVVNRWFDVRTKHVAAFVLFVFGVCLPILGQNERIRSFFEKLRIVIPPLFLAGGFTLGAILTLDIFTGQEEEIAELILSLCLLLFIILEILQPQKKQIQSTSYSKEPIP